MNDWIPGKQKNELTLIIETREIIINEATLIRTMDTGADAFSCTIPWQPGLDPELDELTHHNAFSECGIYIGGEIVMTGVLYDVIQSRSMHGSLKQLHIFTQTADIIDSTMIPPYTARNISLVERCKQLCGPFGIPIVVGDGVNLTTLKTVYKKKIVVLDFIEALESSAQPPDQLNQDNQEVFTKWKWVPAGQVRETQKFSYVAAKQTDKIFNHLRKLAASRGLLLSCTKFGELIITQANTKGTPIGTIEEDTSIAETYTVNYKGRNRFAVYKAYGSSARHAGSGRIQTARDSAIQKPRVLTFRSPENLPGECKNAAEWMKNKSAADSMTFDFPVNSWYGPDDKIWTPNTIVTVKSDIIDIEGGFNFLITKVEYKNDEKGTKATLSLKPPNTYTIGDITEP